MALLNGHEYVDLKLPSGVLWSKFDYGSSSETSAGGTYAWYSGTEKYNPDISNSNFDGRTVLELQDDIVNKNWGGNWCIPTKAQFEELIRYCSISGSDSTNKNYREYSRQGNSIKFPGKNSIYWTNELRDLQSAYVLYNDSDYDDGDYDWYENVDYFSKTNSYRIRPVWVPSLQHTVNVYDNGELIYTETLNRGALFTYKFSNTQNFEFLGYVDESGKLYINSISVNSDLNLTIKWGNKISTGSDNSYEYVDLGLPSGTKWATCNIGANNPEDRGNTYAWGEIETKDVYNQSNYRFWVKSDTYYNNFSKYVSNSNHGIVDNKTTLELSDDAANYNWGGNWRIPSQIELNELKDNCLWVYTKRNNSLGYLILSKTNDNWIFLPETGSSSNKKDCLYLSNTLSYDSCNLALQCDSTIIQIFNNVYRYNKYLVRPINKELTLNVTFYSNNLNNETIVNSVEYAQPIIIPSNPFKNGTSLFMGWNTQFDGFGTQYSENKIITQLTESLNLYAQWFDYSYDGSENGHDYIDLGLPSGTLWATCDIGSSIPTNFGEYYSWGEVETKSTYSSSNYKWYKSGDSLNVLKYNIDPSYGIVDDKVNLDLEDDAARVNWGGDWLIPSNVFFKELIDNCIFEYCGSYIKLTSKINNKILYFPYSYGSNYLSSNYLSNYYCGGITLYDYKLSLSNIYRPDPTLIRPIIKRTTQTCAVIYKNDGVVLKTDTVPFGDRYLVMGEIPTKEGYLFRDWNSVYEPKALIDISSDIELEATWDKTITINLIDQSGQIKNTLSVRETTYKYLPPILVDKGYYCKEYNTLLDGFGNVYYLYTTYNFTEDVNLYAQYEKLNTEYVDFGLPSKILWGKCNIGDILENIWLSNGLHFWFGDPLCSKNRNFYEDYKYIQKGDSTNCYTKYTLDDLDYDGIWYDENLNFIGDGKSVMDKEDDPAYAYLGGNWRTPTKELLEELLKYCIININSRPHKIISKTDSNKYIYLPYTYSYSSSGSNYLLNTLNSTKTVLYLSGTYINTASKNSSNMCIRPIMIPYSITYKNGDFEFIDLNIEFTIKNPGWIDSKKYITSFNTEPNGSGTTYNIGDTITLEEDLTLYAQWKDKLILYIVPEESKILTVYCEPGELVTLEKSYWDKYHNCIGYTTQKDSIEVEYKVGDSITINEDTTLYVIWEDLTNGVEYIDLGLPSGNLWAVNNITGYYSWGEVETKPVYNTNNYKHSISSWNNLNKYNLSKYYCKTGGLIDRKNILELIDDAANVLLKSDWHIPSKDDWQELINLCNWEYTNDGVKITYKNSQDCLYLPLTGNSIDSLIYNKYQAFYWSKDLNKKLSAEAFALFFNHGNKRLISTSRFSGLCIRPVIKIINDVPVNPNPPDEPVEPEEPEVPDFPKEIPETEDEFIAKIGTYNVRYWNGENDSNNRGKIAWPNRRDKVFEFLMNEGIWGVQEVTSVMYSDFINKDGYKYIGYGRGNGLSNEKASGEQIGIFYNTSKYQILNQGSFFYNEQDRSSFNRLCVWVKVQNLINGKKFYIFNNHLAHDSKEVRINQVNTLLFKVSEIAKDEKVFIIGDFNSTSDSEEYQKVTDIYKDSFVLVDEPQGPNITYTGLYSTTDTNQKRIDYIYTNVESIETYKVDDDNKGLEKYPSDHYPVTITYLT